MKTTDFDYHLPETFIAQTPLEPRDSSRVLVLNRKTGELEHRVFNEIGDYLNPGDLLVLNRTRVIPARIYARKPTGGGKRRKRLDPQIDGPAADPVTALQIGWTAAHIGLCRQGAAVSVAQIFQTHLRR